MLIADQRIMIFQICCFLTPLYLFAAFLLKNDSFTRLHALQNNDAQLPARR